MPKEKKIPVDNAVDLGILKEVSNLFDQFVESLSNQISEVLEDDKDSTEEG